jgi:hypothetical protein
MTLCFLKMDVSMFIWAGNLNSYDYEIISDAVILLKTILVFLKVHCKPLWANSWKFPYFLKHALWANMAICLKYDEVRFIKSGRNVMITTLRFFRNRKLWFCLVNFFLKYHDKFEKGWENNWAPEMIFVWGMRCDFEIMPFQQEVDILWSTDLWC